MSEIEKLYRNAGIEPEKKCYYWDCPYSTGMPANDIPYTERNCQDCNNPDKAVYPQFTAEKQLKLFLFVTSLGMCEIEDWKEKGFHFAIQRKNIYPITFLSLSNINFEETIAEIINNLWQSLTEEEKEVLRGILRT